MLEKRRQLETLAQLFLARFVVAHASGNAQDQHFGLNAVTAQHRHRTTMCFFEERRKQLRGLERLPARTAGLVIGQLERELGFRGHSEIASGASRHLVQLHLDVAEYVMWIELEVAHDLREGVPLNLRECQEDVSGGQVVVLPTPGLLDCAVHDPLS